MTTSRASDYWQHNFPELGIADDPRLARLLDHSTEVTVPAGRIAMRRGDVCDTYGLVVSGDFRVQGVSESGREFLIYHLEPGDTCVLSTSCLISGVPYPAEAIAEVDTTAVVLTQSAFNQALDDCSRFRRMVFGNLSQRLGEVISRFEHLQSKTIDRDLASALLKKFGDKAQVRTTHQVLAIELGTSREVVTRHLKRFQGRGLIALSRGEVRLVDRNAITRLVSG